VLNDIVVGLLEAALQKKAQREEQERERLRQEELERQRELVRQRPSPGTGARPVALNDLRAACREHDDLQAFLSQLRAAVGEVEEQSEIGHWLEWASGYLKRIDPLRGRFRAPEGSLQL
jgi:hypothetical protein